MKTLAGWAVDVLIMVASACYTLTGLCGVWAMWKLRREFFIALRSPLLGCMTGASFTLRSCSSTYVYAMHWYKWMSGQTVYLDGVPAWIDVVLAPATLVSTGAMVGWVLRLLVMYDPQKRNKWGRFTNERRVFRVLVSAYVLLEVGVWTVVCIYGMPWVQTGLIRFFDAFAKVGVVLCALVLGRQLWKVQDIGQLSTDAQHVAFLSIISTTPFLVALACPMPDLVFKYIAVFTAIFSMQPVVWTIVIRPVRDFMLGQQRAQDQRQGAGCGGVLFLPPWIWLRRCRIIDPSKNYGRVACSPGSQRQRTSRQGLYRGHSTLHENPLAFVMGFGPLKEAFEEFCSKALCSESFHFLVDVAEYQDLLNVTSGDERINDDFKHYVGIVKEYIKIGSNSEINIACRTKTSIIELGERSAYASLCLEDRITVFNLAEKEIITMLADNLLDKFKATPYYKEIAGDLTLVATEAAIS